MKNKIKQIHKKGFYKELIGLNETTNQSTKKEWRETDNKFEKIVKTYEKDADFHLDACLYGEILDFIHHSVAIAVEEFAKKVENKIVEVIDTWGGFEDDGGNLCHYDKELKKDLLQSLKLLIKQSK